MPVIVFTNYLSWMRLLQPESRNHQPTNPNDLFSFRTGVHLLPKKIAARNWKKDTSMWIREFSVNAAKIYGVSVKENGNPLSPDIIA